MDKYILSVNIYLYLTINLSQQDIKKAGVSKNSRPIFSAGH
jgi:hypothetical protein